MLTAFLKEIDAGITFEQVMEQVSTDIKASFSDWVLPGGKFVVTEAEFIAARDEHLPALRKSLDDYFQTNDLAAMIFPTTQIAAAEIGQGAEVHPVCLTL